MTRTTRDVFIRGVRVNEVKAAIIKWLAENNFKVLINNDDYVYGRWGRGILSAPKFLEVTLVPTEGGVTAKTEGWIAYVPPSVFLYDARAYVPETEFSKSALTYGGVPRKQGMEAIKRLWHTLESLSTNL